MHILWITNKFVIPTPAAKQNTNVAVELSSQEKRRRKKIQVYKHESTPTSVQVELVRRQIKNDGGGPEGAEGGWESIAGSWNKESSVSVAPLASFLLGHKAIG